MLKLSIRIFLQKYYKIRFLQLCVLIKKMCNLTKKMCNLTKMHFAFSRGLAVFQGRKFEVFFKQRIKVFSGFVAKHESNFFHTV